MKRLFVVLMLVFVLALTGCNAAPATETAAPAAEVVATEAPAADAAATEAPAAEEPAAAPAFAVTGLVATPLSFSMEDLQAMNVVEETVTHPKNGEMTVSGVLLSDLLAQAAPSADATTISLIASDGYSYDVALADVQACAECMIAFDEENGLLAVMPGLESKAWVKGIASFEVK